MKIKSVRKLVFAGLGVLFISLIFAGGISVALYAFNYPATLLIVAVLGIAWLISAGLLISSVYSKKKKGYIYIGKHIDD